jgi:drug/metabolite transporter (DMT)-like permease
MIAGVLLLMFTGLCWTFVGAVLSHCTRNKIAVVTLLGPQGVLCVLVAFLFLPDYSLLRQGIPAGVPALVGVMLLAGLANGVGILVMQRAMSMGHHGMTWAIGQSALIMPFLAGLLLFHETPTAWRIAGVGAILSSLIFFGQAREHAEEGQSDKVPRSWFPLALATLVILGVGQVLTSLPSHIPALTDTARLRMPLIYLGSGAVICAQWHHQGGRPNRSTLILAVMGVVIGFMAMFSLFRGLDLLAGCQMASLGFPIAVGSCITLFALYSAIALHEPFSRWHLAGLVLGLTGVVLLASGV